MIDAEFVAVDFQTTRSLSEIGTFGNSTGEFAYIWQSKWVGTMRWRLNEREFTFSAMFSLPSLSLDPKVCSWRHGGHVGSQEQTHFSPLLGTQLYFHVNSSIFNSIVLTPNMAPLSRGCKPRVWERGGHFFAVLSVTTYFYSHISSFISQYYVEEKAAASVSSPSCATFSCHAEKAWMTTLLPLTFESRLNSKLNALFEMLLPSCWWSTVYTN